MDLTLVITHACNLGCTYCYAGRKFGKRMPDDIAAKSLRSAFEQVKRGEKLQVGYFGGEPLLAWDLLKRFHLRAETYAEETGVELVGTVTTNATVLNEDRMDWLVEHGVVVAVSLDGNKQAHDTTRPYSNGKSSFGSSLRGLKIALDRAPLTEVISVVDPKNVGYMADSVRFLLDEGVKVLSLSMNYSADWDAESIAVYEEQMQEVGEEFLRRFRNGEDVYVAQIDAKIVGHLKDGLKACDKCQFGLGELAVAPSGHMYPCERLVGEDTDTTWRIGHVDTGPDFLKLATILGRKAKKDPMCANCSIRNRCANHCGCSNVFSGGDVATPGAALCLTEQINARVADEVAKQLFWEANPLFLRKFYFEEHVGDGKVEVCSVETSAS